MQRHVYDPATGEYLGPVEMAENPEEPGTFIGGGPWSLAAAPPPVPVGHAARLNAAGDGWDIAPDHRGREGYISGEPVKIDALGPLPEGWSDASPEYQPTEAERQARLRAEADAILLPLVMRDVAETVPLADAELATVGAAGYFDAWAAGASYLVGKRLVHEGVVYVVEQPVTALAHQPPGSAGMLAVYRPARPAGGDEPDGSLAYPFDLVVGMIGEAGKFYRHAGWVWECLRAVTNILESWLPGSPGMESFWRKAETA